MWGTWEVVGATPVTTWLGPWVQVGPLYRYRVRAQNRYGLSEPLTFAPAEGRRDAFAVTPVGNYDSRVSGPAYTNAAGELQRLNWMTDGDYVRYDNVVFTRQPYAMDLWVRSYQYEAGGGAGAVARPGDAVRRQARHARLHEPRTDGE